MPPSADIVTRQGPFILAALAVPILGFAASSIFETITEEERKEKDQEAERRAEIIQDLIASLENAEKVALEAKAAEIVEDSKKKCRELQMLKEETEAKAEVEAETEAEAQKLKEEAPEEEKKVEEEQDDDYDDVGQIEFDKLHEKCAELAQVRPGAKELESGVEWCGKLLLKEIQTATTKTEAQKDVRYSDGSKLERLLDCPLKLDRLAQTALFQVSTDLRESIRNAYWKGHYVQRTQKRKDIWKAIKMICMAWETLPWILASNVMSTVATSISTMSLHYRAEVLQALKNSQNSRAPFYKATRAMLIVELIAGMSRTFESQLAARIDRVMAKSLQTKLFLALLSKDTVWWSQQKEAYKYPWVVLDLPRDVKAALDVPRNLANTLASIFIQMQLVRAKSSEMLYSMVALHWGYFFLRKGINWIQTRLQKWAISDVVIVTQSQLSWAQALNPEFVQMFQSFCRGELEAKNLVKYTRCLNRVDELIGAVSAGLQPVHSLMNQGRSIAEYMSMGNLVQRGVVDLTEAETTLHYATDVGSRIESAYRLGDTGSLTSLARAYDYISIPSKIDPTIGFDPGKRSAGHFVFEDVKFAYPGRKVPVLKGVSFEAKTGEAVGITGTTGCGKSTVLRLVERFYDVTGGRILLDGRDIREYSPDWLRSQIVAVSQEPKLIPSTIRENLCFGCPKPPSMEQIEEACRSANIWDVLKDPQKFPNGLETEVDAILNVAGGEKQRICIARAILANPPILLLDEATSALDEISQAHVQEALNKLMDGRTSLVIAHRLSTIKDSDRIIGMDDGTVVDNGTHKELIAKPNGVWKRLWEQQNAEGSPKETAPAPAMPSLQRSTTSTVCKYDLLREMVATLGKTDDAELRQQGVQQMRDMIDKLESHARDTASVDEIPTQSKWGKLRAMHKDLGHAFSGVCDGSKATGKAASSELPTRSESTSSLAPSGLQRTNSQLATPSWDTKHVRTHTLERSNSMQTEENTA